MTQKQLKKHAREKLSTYYKDIHSGKGYLYAIGEAPILLTAHLDTVHKRLPETIVHDRKTDTLSSPQGIGGDDRCGVWIILTHLSMLPYRCLPSILLCEDEEIGGIGSDLFCSKYRTLSTLSGKPITHILELDRKGSHDAVYYGNNNQEYTSYIETLTGAYGKPYTYASGSFSDISNLCPHFGISGVNLSVGYYRQHTKQEYIALPELIHTRNIVIKFVEDSFTIEKPFTYIPWEYATPYAGNPVECYYIGWHDA